MPTSVYFNIIGQCIFHPSVTDAEEQHRMVREAAEAGLANRRLDGTKTDSKILWVENAWVAQQSGGGPFPTMKQGDMVEALRADYGQESELHFLGSVYEGTHLRAYGLLEAIWHDYRSSHGFKPQTIRMLIRPDGQVVNGIEKVKI